MIPNEFEMCHLIIKEMYEFVVSERDAARDESAALRRVLDDLRADFMLLVPWLQSDNHWVREAFAEFLAKHPSFLPPEEVQNYE